MDVLKNTLSRIGKIDESLLDRTQKRLDNLTKPIGSLGRLEEIAKRIVGITEKENPVIKNKIIFTMAGDHGVTAENVSAYPSEVTPQMVYNFLGGGAGINVLARHVGAEVVVVDMGVASDIAPQPGLIISKIGKGTKNFAKGPAMTREEAIASVEAGINVTEKIIKEKKPDIIGTGDMGIGNTTPSSAIAACMTGKPVEQVVGRGTGIDDNRMSLKISVIQKALHVNNPNPQDALDVLQKVGGYEIGGIAGVIIAGAANRIPVVIDGFISGAGALIAFGIEPKTREFMVASHCSVEAGHKAILEKLKLAPIFNLDLRLGEGTGAALGISIVEASVKILNEMATFASAGVSEKK